MSAAPRDDAGRQNPTEPEVELNRHKLTREEKQRGGRSGSRLLAKRAPQRTERGRRIRTLFAGFMENLEAGNPVHEAAALRAAELWVSAEEWRAKLGQGEAVAADVVRLENSARRAERDLRALKPEPIGWWEQQQQGDDDGEEDS
jgi:hypothetical protein